MYCRPVSPLEDAQTSKASKLMLLMSLLLQPNIQNPLSSDEWRTEDTMERIQSLVQPAATAKNSWGTGSTAWWNWGTEALLSLSPLNSCWGSRWSLESFLQLILCVTCHFWALSLDFPATYPAALAQLCCEWIYHIYLPIFHLMDIRLFPLFDS